jgi:hypothetical protein
MPMAELSIDMVRLLLGVDVDDQAAAGLIDWYANLSRGVAAFPEADLKRVEPPLRSTPGPAERT